jgi:hypothetical protein
MRALLREIAGKPATHKFSRSSMRGIFPLTSTHSAWALPCPCRMRFRTRRLFFVLLRSGDIGRSAQAFLHLPQVSTRSVECREHQPGLSQIELVLRDGVHHLHVPDLNRGCVFEQRHGYFGHGRRIRQRAAQLRDQSPVRRHTFAQAAVIEAVGSLAYGGRPATLAARLNVTTQRNTHQVPPLLEVLQCNNLQRTNCKSIGNKAVQSPANPHVVNTLQAAV